MYYDMKDGGRAYGVRGGNGCIRGVSDGQEGYYDMYNNFHPDPPKEEESKIAIDDGPGFFDGMGEQFLETMRAEREKERAKHLTAGQTGASMAGGVAIGVVAATMDAEDPVGSLFKSGRNILCLFGAIALYAIAGLMLLMASGALNGRHYIVFGCLLVPAIVLLFVGVGLIRIMMNKPFLPNPAVLHPAQRENIEAMIEMQQVLRDKKPRRPVFVVLLAIVGVLIVALILGMYIFSR